MDNEGRKRANVCFSLPPFRIWAMNNSEEQFWAAKTGFAYFTPQGCNCLTWIHKRQLFQANTFRRSSAFLCLKLLPGVMVVQYKFGKSTLHLSFGPSLLTIVCFLFPFAVLWHYHQLWAALDHQTVGLSTSLLCLAKLFRVSGRGRFFPQFSHLKSFSLKIMGLQGWTF